MKYSCVARVVVARFETPREMVVGLPKIRQPQTVSVILEWLVEHCGTMQQDPKFDREFYFGDPAQADLIIEMDILVRELQWDIAFVDPDIAALFRLRFSGEFDLKLRALKK